MTPSDHLDSWKEIAAFLRRGVRTVQRWEKLEGLPVHRHQHKQLGSVYAVKTEVAAWWESRRRELAPGREVALSKTAKRRRLLVLPLKNLSGDPAEDYFADGLTEEMITQFMRLRPERLGVIAHSTASHYENTTKRMDEVARELGAHYVLEGSVRRSGERVRLAVRLIESRQQTQVWAGSYDRDLKDVLSLQTDLATEAAREIDRKLAPSEAPGPSSVNPVAYDNYLKGRFHLHRLTPDGFRQAAEWFFKATQQDADYALAWTGLASALSLPAIVPFDLVPPHDVMPKAAFAARRALSLNDALPEAHSALALVLHHYEWKWQEAEAAYRRALELAPEAAGPRLRYAWLLLTLGRTGDALGEIARAQHSAEETDPHLLVVIHATRAAAYYFVRDYEKSIAACEEARTLDPHHFLLQYLRGRAYARRGSPQQATDVLQAGPWKPGEVPLLDMGVGLAHVAAGRLAEARARLEQLQALAAKRYVPATYFGILEAALGNRQKAFEWLEKAIEERADGLILINVEPMVDELRGDERFHSLVMRMGLAG